MRIQAVIFDMGGTIETFEYTRELRLKATPGLQKRLLAAGIDLGLSDEALVEVISAGLQRYHDFSLETLIEYTPGRVWCEFLLAGYVFDPAKVVAAAEDLMLYLETHYYRREMRPEIPEVLQTIQHMGLKIGLISNVNSRGQVPTNLAKYHIQHYFDPIVLSSEYGRRKPDPSIFHYAARLMNVPTSACVYIGDRIQRDIIGAQKAGFRLAIQIEHDFDHGEDDSGATPDCIITDMSELIGILQAELALPEPEPLYPVRAVLFDAGDILYYRPNVGEKFREYLASLGFSQEGLLAERKNELQKQAFRGEISQEQYRRAMIQSHGLTDPGQVRTGMQILEAEQDDITVIDGVSATLHELKDRGFLLGIITDTAQPLHVKLRWFEGGGFGNVWDSIIASNEMGFTKPDPRIYQAALRQLGIQPEEAVFVGHRTSELDGAKAAGITTIAFNYDPDAKADLYIQRFCDLKDLPLITLQKPERTQ